MRNVQHSVRVPPVLDRALRKVAQSRQVTTYALLQQCVRIGIASFSGEQTAPQLTEIVSEIGTLSARLIQVERLIERSLYVACASYVFARTAAGQRTDETKITEEINAAFARQLSLAGEV